MVVDYSAIFCILHDAFLNKLNISRSNIHIDFCENLVTSKNGSIDLTNGRGSILNFCGGRRKIFIFYSFTIVVRPTKMRKGLIPTVFIKISVFV